MPTKKELQNTVRKHNASNCIKYSRLNKAQLQGAIDRVKKPPAKKRIMPVQIKKKTTNPRTKLLKSLAKGNHNKKTLAKGTKGQKTTTRKLTTLATKIAKLKGVDAYPELGI